MYKVFIFLGILFLLLGVITYLMGSFSFGKLPGDIVIQKENYTLYIPLTSMILLSLVLSVIVNLFRW